MRIAIIVLRVIIMPLFSNVYSNSLVFLHAISFTVRNTNLYKEKNNKLACEQQQYY